jgi:hypothetical protein
MFNPTLSLALLGMLRTNFKVLKLNVNLPLMSSIIICEYNERQKKKKLFEVR